MSDRSLCGIFAFRQSLHISSSSAPVERGPGSATSPPRTTASFPPGAAKKRSHADMDNPEKRSRPAPILASSAQDGQTTSGSATPAGICRDPPRTPSYHDSISDRKQPAKRSKSVGRSSSRGKGATSGGEQDEKTRAQAGGSHSSKPKGKPIAYQARVDPAILQLVKYVKTDLYCCHADPSSTGPVTPYTMPKPPSTNSASNPPNSRNPSVSRSRKCRRRISK